MKYWGYVATPMRSTTRDHTFFCIVNLGTSRKWRETSRTGPVERDVLARIRRPLKLEAERIDGADRCFAPSHELSGPGLGARRVHELRIFSRRARRAGQGFGPGLHLAGDLVSPLATVGRDLERDPRALHAPQLPAFGEQRSDESRKPSDLAAENAGKHLRLALVGAIVDEDAGAPLGLPCPEIAFPSSHPHEAQTVQIDIAVMALPDVPEQDRLAEAVVRGLSERAGARDSAAAIVEPVSRDVPAGRLGHENLHERQYDVNRGLCHRQRNCDVIHNLMTCTVSFCPKGRSRHFQKITTTLLRREK